ncbi:uncharacterized protein [Argopecten irradians]|uniref:uncharacterized protein n=1 Tax=Argopecten irradians TaxID=31199 RepID=UPI003712663E
MKVLKSKLFEILDTQFKDVPLTDDVVIKIKSILENLYFTGIDADTAALKVFKAYLYRLRNSAKECRKRGGTQFSLFLKSLSCAYYTWKVALCPHGMEKQMERQKVEAKKVCDAKLKEQKNSYLSVIKEKEKEKKQLEEKFHNYIATVKETPGSTGKDKKRKPFSDLANSSQSKRRKVEKDFCKDALSSLDDFGLKPVSVIVTRGGKQEIINIYEKENNTLPEGSENTRTPDQNNTSQEDVDELNMLVYVLDVFNVSREAYGNISMLYQTLPRRHIIQKYISKLNSKFKITDTPDGLGVQQSFKDQLTNVLKSMTTVENGDVITVKVSGDGTNVGKRLHFVNMTFAVINEKKCISAQGNYPLCILCCKENYEGLSKGLADIRKEVSDLQGSTLNVDGREFEIKIVLGGTTSFFWWPLAYQELWPSFSVCTVNAANLTSVT